jgi:hypothetical protein
MNNQGRRRERIVKKIQERIYKIDKQIEDLQPDKELYQSILSELNQRDYYNDKELSIEFIESSDRAAARLVNSGRKEQVNKSVTMKAKTKAQEREEERAKARAWHINRVRNKEKARNKKLVERHQRQQQPRKITEMRVR